MIPKYRAWYKDEQKIYEVKGLSFSNGELYAVELWSDEGTLDGKWHEYSVYLRDVELMLSTGRNDKNGKEIYKGDIVLLGYSDGSVHEKPVEVKFGLHRVGFDSDAAIGATALGFYFSPYPGTEDDDSEVPMGIGETFDWDNDHIEVIGNVYEHQHLLEDRKDTA